MSWADAGQADRDDEDRSPAFAESSAATSAAGPSQNLRLSGGGSEDLSAADPEFVQDPSVRGVAALGD